MDAARSGGVIAADVTPIGLMLGVEQLSRTLPTDVPEELRTYEQWLLDVFLRGLASQG